MVLIRAREHRALHSKLVAFATFFDRILGVEFRKDKSVFSYANKGAIKSLAETPVGRKFIVKGLNQFYKSDGWFNSRGYPSFYPTFISESQIFIGAPPPYHAGH